MKHALALALALSCLHACAVDVDEPTATTSSAAWASAEPDASPADADASSPADSAARYYAPGELTVRWRFPGASLDAGCEARGATRVRVRAGLGAPTVLACAAGAIATRLPAGTYSVGVELLDAGGDVLDARDASASVSGDAPASVALEF